MQIADPQICPESAPGRGALPSKPERRGAARAPEVVKSAVRVLEMLEFFDRTQAAANVGQVATALAYPQSSTSALLRSLVKIGYLRFDPRARTYMPTERVPLLGNWVARSLFRGGPLLGMIEVLAKRLDCAVVLARRNGDHAQFVHIVDPRHAAIGGATIGTIRPLACTAPGLALLSLVPDSEVRRLLHRLNAEAAPQDIVRIPELLVRLADVRSRGHAVLVEDATTWIALPLPQDATQGPLVIVLTLPPGDAQGETECVAATRQEIARWLRPARARLPPFDVPPGLAARQRMLPAAHVA